MLDFFQALLLGIVQGITEWLPVSSSGHLVILQESLGISAGYTFDLMLHLATLLVVVLVFHRDIRKVLKAFFSGRFRTPEGRLALFIILGSVPTALIGYFLEAFFRSSFTNVPLVGGALLFTGCLLFLTRFQFKPGNLDFRRSLWVGIFQGIAITPGVSRSGATISSSLLSGVGREESVRFSFLLSIPAILGALAFLLQDAAGLALSNPLPVLAGMVVSVLVGYASLRLLIRLVLNRKLHWFSLYCWALGAVLLLLYL